MWPRHREVAVVAVAVVAKEDEKCNYLWHVASNLVLTSLAHEAAVASGKGVMTRKQKENSRATLKMNFGEDLEQHQQRFDN